MAIFFLPVAAAVLLMLGIGQASSQQPIQGSTSMYLYVHNSRVINSVIETKSCHFNLEKDFKFFIKGPEGPLSERKGPRAP